MPLLRQMTTPDLTLDLVYDAQNRVIGLQCTTRVSCTGSATLERSGQTFTRQFQPGAPLNDGSGQNAYLTTTVNIPTSAGIAVTFDASGDSTLNGVITRLSVP